MIVSMNLDKKTITVTGPVSHTLEKILNRMEYIGWTVKTLVK